MGPIIVITLLAAQGGPIALPPMPPPPRVMAAPPPPVIHAPAPPPSPIGKRPATPRGNPGTWVTSNDYPSRALREELEGTTRFRLIVSADGRTSHCEVRESSGSLALDQTTCSTIRRRARFNPAIDHQGAAIEGSWTSAVRWQIPTDGLQTLGARNGFQRFVIAADGSITHCRRGNPYSEPSGYSVTCDPVAAYQPFRDSTGAAAARQVTITTIRSISDAD